MRRLALAPLIVLAALPTAASAAPAGSTLLVGRASGFGPLAPGITNDSFTRYRAGETENEAGENVSDNGTRIVFVSDADGLSSADNNRFSNCFVRDTVADTTVLVSRAN